MAKNINAFIKTYETEFKSLVIQSALAYITAFKRATLKQIADYFEMTVDEQVEVEERIDFKGLNFIGVSRKFCENHAEGVLFEFINPRMWHEYKKRNNQFTKAML